MSEATENWVLDTVAKWKYGWLIDERISRMWTCIRTPIFWFPIFFINHAVQQFYIIIEHGLDLSITRHFICHSDACDLPLTRQRGVIYEKNAPPKKRIDRGMQVL